MLLARSACVQAQQIRGERQVKIINLATGDVAKIGGEEVKPVFSPPVPAHVDELDRDSQTDVPLFATGSLQMSQTMGGAYHPRYNNTRWMRRYF
jgi:hypothetical protein